MRRSVGRVMLPAVLLAICLASLPAVFAEQVLFTRNSAQGVFSETVTPMEIGTEMTVSEPPLASGGLSFTHWTVNGIRQNAVTGQARTAFSWTVLGHTTVTAHYLPTTDDTNTNGIQDWLEWRLYGGLLADGLGLEYDADGDGVGHAKELELGTEPTIPDQPRDGGLMLRLSATSVLRDEALKKRYEIRSEPQGVLTAQMVHVDVGTEQWTPSVAYGQFGSTGYYFGYWEIDGVRQTSGSGLSLPRARMLMDRDHVAIARFFPAGDSDSDSMEDWREWNWFGNLAQDGTGDPDNDGVSTAEELIRGSQPHLHDHLADGGVMLRLSGLATLRDEALKKRYEIRSEPQGVLAAQTTHVDAGTEQWPPSVAYGQFGSTGYYFGYWEIDGVRQASGSGLSLPKARMLMDRDHVAIARFFPAGDGDGDSMEDWREWNWFGNLTQNGTGDPDNDGISTAEELSRGSQPHLHDFLADGGIMMRLGPTATKKQFFQPEPMVLIDGVLSEMFASSPWQVNQPTRYADLWENALLLENTEIHPALGDWDGDGDLDFFYLRSDHQLVAFENIGSSFLVNLSDRSQRFSLATTLSTMPDRLLGFCLADWNGDGHEDLAIGRPVPDPAAAEVVVVLSPGDFLTDTGESRVSVHVLPTLEAGQQYHALTVGDLNHDGIADLVAATGDINGATTIRVFPGTAHGGGFASTASAQFDITATLGVCRHMSLAISREQEADGVGHLQVADAYGTILKFDYAITAGSLNLVRTDWGGTFRDFAQRPNITVGDIDGDGDGDLITGFVTADADGFPVPGGTFRSGIGRNTDPRLAAPFHVTASNGAGSILVEWIPNREYSLDGYFVYRSTSPDGPWTMVWGQEVSNGAAPTNAVRFADNSSDLAAGVAYYYKVAAVTAVHTKGSPRPTYYVGSPSVSNAAYVGAVHFALSEPVRSPTGKVEVSVTLDWGEAVAGAGMQLKIAYDPAVLRAAKISAGAAAGDLSFTDNRATATGELIINGTGGSLRGKGEILRIYFDEVSPSPLAKAMSFLRHSKTSEYGPAAPDAILTLFVLQIRNIANQVLVPPPSVQVQVWLAQLGLAGDLNYDSLINDNDIPVMLSRIVQGKLDRLSVAGLLPIADLDRDGTLSSGDIPVLRRKIREALGQVPTAGSTPTAATYAVDAPETNGRASDQVSMPLALSDASGLAAVYLQVNYDRNLLTYLNTERPAGSLGNQFDMNVTESEGVLHIVMNRDAALASGAGTLANLEFRINPGARPGMVADVVVAEASLTSDSGAASWWRSKLIQGKGRVNVTLSPNTDADGDGLSDLAEQMANGSTDYDPYDPVTNPSGRDSRYNLADTDGDGLRDGFEITHHLNPVAFGDQLLDLDNDGLNNLAEQTYATDPNNGDTDGDGMPDGAEIADGTNPLVNDARLDPDLDGYPNLVEYAMGSNLHAQDDAGKLPALTPVLDANGLFFRFSFTRRINDPFASLMVQESADLAGWHTLPFSRAMIGVPEAAGAGLERLTIETGGPLAATRFLRLAAAKRTDHDRDGLPDDFEQSIADTNPADEIYGPEDILPGGDFDGDGTSNAAEFLFGMDSTLPGEADHLPQFWQIEANGHSESRFVFRIRRGIAPTTYAVERSDDGTTWQPCDHLPLLSGPPQELDDGTEEFIFKAIKPSIPGQPVQFRLVVLPAE